MGGFIVFAVVVGVAIWLLRRFDKIAGRGPKQVKDGINQSALYRTNNEARIPCPYCAELILPAARLCQFCKSEIG